MLNFILRFWLATHGIVPCFEKMLRVKTLDYYWCEWRMKTDNILAILCSFSKKVYNHSIYSRVSIQTLHTSSNIIIISSLFIRCLHVYWYLLFDYFSNAHVIVLCDGADPIRQSLISHIWRRTDWNDVEVAKIFW